MNDGKIFASGRGTRPRLRWAALVACLILAAGVITGCGRHRHEGAKTPEEFRQRFDKATQRALKKADVTDDQKARIKPIADEMATALYGFREEHRAIRSRFVKAFEAEKVDPAEVAKIREDAVALADKASRTMTEAIVKASAVLTPEQRRKLAERWKKCM
jgi:Spy/CpxP family protein refolding chaperone